MRRIFTFGCSFTAYSWPTWATIVAYELQLPLYNFAQPGMGNFGIFSTMIQADIRYKFTDEDIIMVLWSSWDREDRIHNEKWNNSGTVFADNFYDRKFLKKYWNSNNDVVTNSTSIIAANKIYGNKIVFQATGFKYFNSEHLESDASKYFVGLYKKSLPKLHKWDAENGDWAFNGLCDDIHPDILKHLEFASNVVLPTIEKNISENTVEKFNQIQTDICNILEKNKKIEMTNCISLVMKSYPDIKNLMYNYTITDLLLNRDNH